MQQINELNAQLTNKTTRIITTRVPLTDLIRRDFESIPNSDIRCASGAGYKVLALIDNIADCYLFAQMGTMRWDTCAVEAIVSSLNGSLTDVFTKDYSYTEDQRQLPHNFFGVLATLSKQNAYFASFISTELKEKLINDAHLLKIKMKIANN
jgi:3'-phosphoadenosine 5'-phosphosulfate (PAPS) 3'-phosphatase